MKEAYLCVILLTSMSLGLTDNSMCYFVLDDKPNMWEQHLTASTAFPVPG